MVLRKICLLGDVAVGKTSLIRRFVDRQFSDSYLSTVGVKISRKRITVPAGTAAGTLEITLILWDLEGGISPKVGSPSYLRGAHGAIVVGDLTRPPTLESIQRHIDHFSGVNPGTAVVVALNKCDLAEARGRPAGPWVAAANRLPVLITSAKSGEGVDNLFAVMGARLAEGADHGSAA